MVPSDPEMAVEIYPQCTCSITLRGRNSTSVSDGSHLGGVSVSCKVGAYLDGVHDDSETGNGELVGLPQVVIVQVSEEAGHTY